MNYQVAINNESTEWLIGNTLNSETALEVWKNQGEYIPEQKIEMIPMIGVYIDPMYQDRILKIVKP